MGNGEDFTLKAKKEIPVPPPFCGLLTKRYHLNRLALDVPCVPSTMSDVWDRLFDEAYRADVLIHTESDIIIYAHASILVSCLFYFHCYLR